MTAIFKPLSAKDLLKPSGQVGIQLEGEDAITPFGHATLTFKKSSTKSEIRTPESPGREIVGTDYAELTGMVDIEFSNLNKLGMALAFMAKVENFSQAAVPATTQVFANVSEFQWLELRTAVDGDGKAEPDAHGVVGSVVSAVTAGGTPLVLDTHYKHDAPSGTLQIIGWPDGAEDGDDVSVTFTAPSVAATPARSRALLLQNLVVRGRLVLRQNNLRGRNRKLVIPQIAFGGESGDVQLIQDGNDVVKVQVSGTIEADFTQKAGFENGWTEDL